MSRLMVVNSIPETEYMSRTAVELVRKFNSSGRKLILEVFNDYIGRTVEDILEEGMYFYTCSDTEIIKLLDELVNGARPVFFSTEDIVADITLS